MWVKSKHIQSHLIILIDLYTFFLFSFTCPLYLKSNPFSLVSSKNVVFYKNSSYENSHCHSKLCFFIFFHSQHAIQKHEWRVIE